MKTPWIIMNPARGGSIDCLRCGTTHTVHYPIEPWALASLCDGFTKEHKDCGLKAEGLHCHFCGKTGHDPLACPKLGVTTVDEWLKGPDTGISSRTIVHALFGVGLHGIGRVPQIPIDADDFGRCYRLVRAIPEVKERLHEVGEKIKGWAPFIREWDALAALYEEEVKDSSSRAPKLNALMKKLVAESEGR